MWKNYLVVGLRALVRNKTYAVINIADLSLGLAACLTVLLYVRYELTYDAWLPDAARTFQLQQWITRSDDPDVELGGTQMTSYVSGERLRQFPQVEQVVYAGQMQPVILQDGEGTVSDHFLFVNGPLFDVLRIPFLRGDPGRALVAPGELVLTETEAQRRFGTIDVVGRTLALVAGGRTTDYRIVGVVQDPPRESHLALSVVARVDFETLYGGSVPFLTQWMPKNGWVYARLRPGADVAEIARQMPAWERRNIPDRVIGGERVNPGTDVDWRLINVRDIHLGESQNGMRPTNDRGTIVALGIVGVLILAMAVINFVNLATARAGQRAREVALRKVLGASRRQLIAQFLGESILLTATAMLIAVALVEMLLPTVNALLDADLRVRYFGEQGMLLPIPGLILIVGGAGGLYPAFILSRYRPASVLKANQSSTDPAGSGRLRNILVVGQFAVSIALIICTSVIYAQTAFARTIDVGYRSEGILQVGNIYRSALRPVLDTMLREIGAVEGVTSVGRSTIGVATWGMENMTVTAPGATEPVEFELYRIDPGFFRTMDIPTVAGRTFSERQAMDDSTLAADLPDGGAEATMARRGYNVVLNELAARRLGFARPADAIGRTLRADDGDVETVGRTPVTIIGVVGNSRFRSIREPVAATMFLYERTQPGWLLVRYSGDPTAVRDRVERVWKRIAPEVPFEAEFSEDIIRQLYDAEETRSIVFTTFAALAVIVACLGLFGLAAFTADRRTKEIGIRKVFGATVLDIVKLLAWQFSKPVIVANLIAWPVAWWVMRDWLNGFDARVDLGPGPFVVAGLLAFVIALGTIAGHALRVSRTNPIVALRYE
ncbi:FtsX-like permease family protein [Sphingosinicella sp. LHD-64]|uniref:FtsX-like permease family protein n=1 Tax=Sphingosinicella sp. LHD-64 TaxID=3072139 RepID=UPI00280F761B|nr:FtsX-like permease family protein [Sphingosinicella sp. LHD-64]MDQ8756105.1 FtsX-like permease family protein [Sphingosinicella sp. LHD-64]